LASAETTFHCIHSCRLAEHGITGPLHVFEGPMELGRVLGRPFGVDWERETYNGVLACSLKKFNAEFHAQPCVEGLLELRQMYGIQPASVRRIAVDISKEDADHSLHYMLAVALVDGQLKPEQFERRRIQSEDVQQLLQNVSVRPKAAYNREYPQKLRCRIAIRLADGQQIEKEKSDFQGFYTRPMKWEESVRKFRQLGRAAASDEQLQQVIDCITQLETKRVREFTSLLSAVAVPGEATASPGGHVALLPPSW